MSDLNSSASWVGSFEDACSTAKMYASMVYFYGKYACLAKLHLLQPPTPPTHQTTPPLQQHHLGKFLIFFIC